MSLPTILVLVAFLPLTVLGLALFGRSVVGRVRDAYRDARSCYERLEPALAELQTRGEVTRRELQRLETRSLGRSENAWGGDGPPAGPDGSAPPTHR